MQQNTTKPTSVDSIYLTSEGLTSLRQELEYLTHTKRIELSERFAAARENENTEESAEFEAVAEEQTLVEKRIAELESILHNAKIVKHEDSIIDSVNIGSTVLVDIDGATSEYTVVGRMEANPSLKRISNESPMGAALLGSKKGETVTVVTPQKSYSAKIIDIK